MAMGFVGALVPSASERACPYVELTDKIESRNSATAAAGLKVVLICNGGGKPGGGTTAPVATEGSSV